METITNELPKDMERLRHPFPAFKLFIPTRDKLRLLATRLYENYLWISDEYRNQESITALLAGDFLLNRLNIWYELGDYDGLVGFLDIVPGHKCRLAMKLWNPLIWKPSIVKQGRKLIRLIMDEFRLRRVSSDSADNKMVHMATMVGFKKEGARKHEFRWNGKFMPLVMLGLTRG
jgi:hypothetical protein